MRGLISFCVRRHGAVATLCLLALLAGGWRITLAPLDVFPEFVPSQVDIQTEAPGFAPQQVEELVTKRIESAVNGAGGLATLRSQSIPGLSVVTITFADTIDVHAARQGISERLSELGGSLPAGVGPPRLSPLVSSTMDLLKIGLLADHLDSYALRDAADWVIKPPLLAVPGVAHVVVFGGSVRQMQIAPDPGLLASYGLTLTDVANGVHAALALRGAGFMDLAAQRILLTTPAAKPDAGELGEAVIAVRQEMPVRLRDVAVISQAPALRSGDALIMGRPGVMLALASQYGANTLTTTLAVEKVLADLEPALKAQGITVYPALHRPANFIERALGDLEHSLAIASALILIVLYLFLRDARASLIAFTAIPLSLLAAVLILTYLGLTLNTMTLGGFAVALGVLVDDGIIDIENILRRLHLNALLSRPLPRLRVIRDASLEVRGPVVYATLVASAVFLPELFATNVQGRFVGPLALAFILAVLASLFAAATATPALCALLLREGDARAETSWVSALKRLQRRAVGAAITRFQPVVALLAAAAAAAAASLPFLGGVFMPDFREGHLVVQASSSIPGTSLTEMMHLGERVSAEILRLPYVKTIEQQIGRAELGEDTWGVHQSEFHVELRPDTTVDQGSAQEALRAIMRGYPGIQSEVVTFLGDRIGESLSGETAQVAVKVYGDDLDVLDRIGDRMVQVLQQETGVVDLRFTHQGGTPIIDIESEPRRLAALGLSNQAVLDTLQTAYSGTTVGQTYEGSRTVDAVLILPDGLRHAPEELGKLMISGPFGPVPLSAVARVTLSTGRYSVEHEGGERRISVNFNVSGRGLQETVNEAKKRISQSIPLPPGYFINYTGAAAAEHEARNQLALYTGFALALILMVLFIAFRWRANSLLVLVNVPFSLIGGVAAIAATHIGLSLGSLVGLVTVFGISARNTILQLAHYEHLVLQENAPWNLDTVLRGANERLIPILMTAAVTALALMPIALTLNHPGQEIEGPMAVTVLGGLVSSTVLNLVVLPAFAQRFSRRAP